MKTRRNVFGGLAVLWVIGLALFIAVGVSALQGHEATIHWTTLALWVGGPAAGLGLLSWRNAVGLREQQRHAQLMAVLKAIYHQRGSE